MIGGPNMQFIDKLESKLGRYAIPGLIQIIAVFQICVLALLVLLPRESAMNYIEFLRFDRDLIFAGQVWRLLTNVLVLELFFTMQSMVGMLFWGFFGAQVMMFFGRGLEHGWGAFRVNLYVAAWFLVSWIFGLVFGVALGGMLLASTILLAFASKFPNEELLLFFILPVKIKWIAWIAVGMMMFEVMKIPLLLLLYVPGHLNFLVTFGPGFVRDLKHATKVTDRRSRFAAAAVPAGAFFHQCSMCQKTEIDDPQLDFRVLASGDEICHVCRAKRDAAPAS